MTELPNYDEDTTEAETLPLDPYPVRYHAGLSRTAMLSLLRTFPGRYIFHPRPGYEHEREAYREEVHKRHSADVRIVGADYSTEATH